MDQAVEAARGDTPLTYFEYGTLAALWLVAAALQGTTTYVHGAWQLAYGVMVASMLVGVCTAIQTSVNGYMGGIAGSSLHAGEINLAVGALLLLVAALVSSPRQLARRPEPGPWWMWVGGLVGATFVISGATLAPRLGTATTVIAFNAGTIAAGQALEARGAFGARKNPLTAMRLLGLVVIFLGVLAVRLL